MKFGFADQLSESHRSFHFVPVSSWMATNMVGAKILQKVWEGPCWEGVWPSLDPWDVVGLRTTASVWKVPGKYGPHGVGDATSKACALIGLHIIAEEAELGGMWRCGGPRIPLWKGDVRDCTERVFIFL